MRRMIRIAEPLIGREELEAVAGVLKSGLLTTKGGDGPYVRKLEETFAKYIGVKYAVAASSGTAALHSALLAADVGGGDEVILPSFTFSATAEAVVLAGGKPVFVDIDPATFCMDVESFEHAVTSKTRAVIPVHLFGHMADMEKVCKIARENDLVVIEDAAQAHGAAFKGKRAGSFGEFGCFSFYPSKNMTSGEGGIITTNKRDYAEALMSIRCHGETKLYVSARLGHNYRLSEISAALAYHQLLKLPRFLEARSRNARKITNLLETLGKLILPTETEDYTHTWQVYTVRLRGSRAGERNRLVAKLMNSGIETGIYYSTPLHLAPFYRRSFGYKPGTLPKTEMIARQVFSLPVHPNITDDDLRFIHARLKKLMS